MRQWPFRANWAEPVVERYAFLTEIITSDSGNEQRRDRLVGRLARDLVTRQNPVRL